MSARARLVTELTEALPADRYLVAGTWATPDQLEPGRLAVRCWVSELRPGPRFGTLTVDLVLWVLTPATTPTVVDAELDTALLDLMDALHTREWVQWTSATRAVLEDYWHGYRFDLTAAALLAVDETTDVDAGAQLAPAPPLED